VRASLFHYTEIFNQTSSMGLLKPVLWPFIPDKRAFLYCEGFGFLRLMTNGPVKEGECWRIGEKKQGDERHIIERR